MFNRYKQILLSILILISTTQCGFKVLDKSNLLDLKITEIKTQGDKKLINPAAKAIINSIII